MCYPLLKRDANVDKNLNYSKIFTGCKKQAIWSFTKRLIILSEGNLKTGAPA